MLEAIVAGIVAQVAGSIIATLIQQRLWAKRPPAAIEYIPENRTVTIHRSIVRLGPVTYRRTTTEVRIENASFKLIDPSPRAFPIVVGFLLAVIAFAAVMLV